MNSVSPDRNEKDDVVSESSKTRKENLLDYLLYSLAGGVFAVISFTFILWLRL